jgi:uncharacterized protein YigA (DUF484 family)
MDAINPASEQEVVKYLTEHANFFKTHPDLLATMYIPSLHGGGTVSLAERQQLVQRDKIRALETKMAELIQYAKENDAISENVHKFTTQLIRETEFESLLLTITHAMRQDFQVPYTGIRLWAQASSIVNKNNRVFNAVDVELNLWAESLADPYCGLQPGLDFVTWFGENAIPKSFALIALRNKDKVFGLLALASDDEKRFYPEMGTMYLSRMGELIGGCLQQHIEL